MRALTARTTLQAWERGERRDATGRALALLSAVLPDRSPDELAALTLGQRDAALFEVRRRTFGPELAGRSRCPRCRSTLEFSVDTRELTRAGPPPEGAEVGTVERDGWTVRFRLPTGGDLADAATAGGEAAARARLLARCVVEARRGGEAAAVEALPEPVVAAVGEAMEAADPLAELPLVIECAGCTNRWWVVLDIGSFLWGEIAALAERLLYEVHALATAYGWSEAEVLAMSAVRRQRYLDLLPTA